MRWTILIDKYRTLTNYVGVILIGWILSLIVGQGIRLLFLETSTASAAIPSQSSRRSDKSLLSRSDKQTLAYYKPICNRNIFDSEKRSPCEEEEIGTELQFEPENTACPKEPEKTSLSHTLLGTMVSNNPDASFATISKKGEKDSTSFYINDSIFDDGKIYDIVRNRVYIIRNGCREFIEVANLPSIYAAAPARPQRKSGSDDIKIEGNKIVVSRDKVEATLGDLNKVIQQARMVPHFRDGAVNGFKIFAIRPKSIFKQLGLKNGDIIERINGTEINSVERAIPMLQLAKSSDEISIDLKRRGKKKSLTIEIR